MPVARRRLSPAQLLAISLLALIVLGTLLLALPVSATGKTLSLTDAFFTSTSAVCVTGLIVVDTPVDLSLFGQLVLMMLIQAGGLGYMAITTVVSVALGRQLSVQERITLQEALNVHSMEGLIRFTFTVLKLTLLFELAGAALLAIGWSDELGPVRAAYFGLFHAISAFNNAGFSLFSDNLIGYRGDWLVNLVICGLIIVGGLGFVVLVEAGRWRRGRRMSVHSRLVLALTGVLVVGGTMAILVLESRNPLTLGALPPGERVLAAFFQAVVPRTAGFNTVVIGALTAPSLFLMIVMMFVGAAPGGTGGGIKVTTLGITMAALWATVRGSGDATVFHRRLDPSLVARAFFISLIAFLALNAIAALLLVVEQRPLLPTLFEATSAFGTVGLSMGEGDSPLSLSGFFGAGGKLLIALLMFMGRIGPLTLAIAVAHTRERARIRYPEGKVLVG